MTRISDIFGKSPVGPLEKHIRVAADCAAALPDFFDAVIDGDWERAGAQRERIGELEQKADNLKKEIRLDLPKGLFMPVSRSDLLGLLTAQDEIANQAQRLADLVYVRKMSLPEPLREDFRAFVARNVDAATQAAKSVLELDELFTTGFRGAEAGLVTSMINELDSVETDNDRRHYALLEKLHELESSLGPVDAVFLFMAVSQAAEIGFKAEQVGRRLELLLSR